MQTYELWGGLVCVFSANVLVGVATTLWGFYGSIYCGPVIGDWPQLLISWSWTRDKGRALELDADRDPGYVLDNLRVEIGTQPLWRGACDVRSQVTGGNPATERRQLFKVKWMVETLLRGKKTSWGDFWYALDDGAGLPVRFLVVLSLADRLPCSLHKEGPAAFRMKRTCCG